MKTYILYHANCLDGFGAAFAAWLKFGDQAEYIPVSYGQPVPRMEMMSDIFIVDFSYPKAKLSDLSKNHRAIVVLDHHKTAEAELAHGADIVGVEVRFDMTKSGAVMAWEYFHPNTPVPELFLYIQDRDLWQWKLPKSREFSAALRIYPMAFSTWMIVGGVDAQGNLPDVGSRIAKMQEQGTAILRFQNQQVEMQTKNSRMCNFWTGENNEPFFEFGERVRLITTVPLHYHVPTVNCTCFISEVCEKLLELYPSAPFVAAYRDTNDGKREWSLRSRKDFDCSVIAKAFGGGGHAQACGFKQ